MKSELDYISANAPLSPLSRLDSITSSDRRLISTKLRVEYLSSEGRPI